MLSVPLVICQHHVTNTSTQYTYVCMFFIHIAMYFIWKWNNIFVNNHSIKKRYTVYWKTSLNKTFVNNCADFWINWNVSCYFYQTTCVRDSYHHVMALFRYVFQMWQEFNLHTCSNLLTLKFLKLTCVFACLPHLPLGPYM